MQVLKDTKHNFISMFNPNTGFYVRTGVLDQTGKDTGVDPFMASYPQLLDIGVMQTCVCAHRCNVDCYQKAIDMLCISATGILCKQNLDIICRTARNTYIMEHFRTFI